MHLFVPSHPSPLYGGPLSEYDYHSTQTPCSSSDGDDLSTPAFHPPPFEQEQHTYKYTLSGPGVHPPAASLPSPQLSFGYPVPRSFWSAPQPYYHTHAPLPHLAPGDTYTSPDVPLYSPTPVPGTNWPVLAHPSPSSLPSHVQNPADPPPPGVSADSQQDLLEVYASAPRELFPTPTEILKGNGKRRASTARDSDRKVETQRKVRQRIVAESIGFPPTDPDTISSHDKKRYYLECLEQYVSYLHEQLTLVGHDPVPLERVSSYRGLTSRSIRTMMVNMQGVVRQAHQETLEEERNFLDMREELMALEADGDHQCSRRHSIASCSGSDSVKAGFSPF
ncbi:hypothetical protein BV25DRAFT_1819130 [Artomyces pyxidatus]|uniref:Uncharacterized protein n=1 Tax=Artomyces pyxidatus TaxID=48021 RepID=A0ACB8TH54_9AGAM|nr:hypothetical protein BV25DRAFT_1819130 [Artomyces pyxidatus]